MLTPRTPSPRAFGTTVDVYTVYVVWRAAVAVTIYNVYIMFYIYYIYRIHGARRVQVSRRGGRAHTRVEPAKRYTTNGKYNVKNNI